MIIQVRQSIADISQETVYFCSFSLIQYQEVTEIIVGNSCNQ
jgi:hypothetical protein